MIHLLYYLHLRLREQKVNSEDEYFYKELIIQTINDVYKKLDIQSFDGGLLYGMDYELPLFLFVLSNIYNSGFYNTRITRILEELSTKIFSTIPILHSNKLFLLWGMNSIQTQISITEWKKHMQLLRKELDINHIVDVELKNKNVFFNNGITSIFMLVSALQDSYFTEEEITLFKKKVIKKIDDSHIWNFMLNDSDYFKSFKGLFNGFCGTFLFLNIFQ